MSKPSGNSNNITLEHVFAELSKATNSLALLPSWSGLILYALESEGIECFDKQNMATVALWERVSLWLKGLGASAYRILEHSSWESQSTGKMVKIYLPYGHHTMGELKLAIYKTILREKSHFRSL